MIALTVEWPPFTGDFEAIPQLGMTEVFGRRYGVRRVVLSIFQFAQTIAVYGFAN